MLPKSCTRARGSGSIFSVLGRLSESGTVELALLYFWIGFVTVFAILTMSVPVSPRLFIACDVSYALKILLSRMFDSRAGFLKNFCFPPCDNLVLACLPPFCVLCLPACALCSPMLSRCALVCKLWAVALCHCGMATG